MAAEAALVLKNGRPRAAYSGDRSAVGQKVFRDVVAVGLEQHGGAAQLADLLLGPFDHAVALAAVGVEHLAGAGDLEALLGAGLGLELGHLALLLRQQPRALGPADRILLV